MIELPMEAIPCPRPRVGRWGTYYPAKYEAWKKEAVLRLRQYATEPIEQALSVFIDCELMCPRSWSQKKVLNAIQTGGMPVGDADNFGKSSLDACTQAGIWKDDKQVVILTVRKRYSARNHITIRIMPLERSVK